MNATNLAPQEAPRLEQRPLGELLGQLTRDLSLLVQQEVSLAKREANEKLRQVGKSLASLAIGGVVLHVGALPLTAAITLLLAEALPAWLAALIVGVAISAVGAVLLQKGKQSLQQLDLKPEQLSENVKRDVDAIKEAVR